MRITEQLMESTREFQKYRSIYLYTEEQINELVADIEKSADESKRE